MKNSTSRAVAQLEAALEADPPVIQWVKNSHGVMVAADIYDPHADHTYEKDTCRNGHPYEPGSYRRRADGKRQCRKCRRVSSRRRYLNRAAPRETELLAAARTEL